jgi:hypothetical protein
MTDAMKTGDPEFLDPTREQTFRVWCAFFWPQAAAMVASSLLNLSVPSNGLAFVDPLFRLLAWFALILAGLRYAFGRTYPDFRVALVRPLEGDTTPLPLTLDSLSAIAWGYLWRTFLATLFLGFIVAIPIALVAGDKKPLAGPVGTLLIFLFVSGLSYYIFQASIINGIFDDVQVELLSNEPTTTQPSAPAPVASA